jgi:hypothetical protein
MADYPAFQKPTWPIRDWAGLEEFYLDFWWVSTITPLEPGETLEIDTITVPQGFKYYITHYYVSAQFDGEVWHYFSPGLISRGFFQRYGEFFLPWSTPAIYPPGTSDTVYIRNDDIVAGHWEIAASGYRRPASEPPKPKSDDPEEIYRTLNFTECRVMVIDSNKRLKVFRNGKEDKFYMLYYENYGKVKDKPDFKGKFKNEDLNKVLSELHPKPEKAKDILMKYESNRIKK